MICWSLVCLHSRNLRLQMRLPYQPRCRRREDRANRDETRDCPRIRWNSMPHTPRQCIKSKRPHFHRTSLDGSSSSRIRYGHPTFHSTRLQLICRDNHIRFRDGKSGAGSSFAVGRKGIRQRPSRCPCGETSLTSDGVPVRDRARLNAHRMNHRFTAKGD